MSHFHFARGVRLVIDQDIYHILKKLPEQRWQLENEVNGEIISKTEDEMHRLYRENTLRFLNTNNKALLKTGVDICI